MPLSKAIEESNKGLEGQTDTDLNKNFLTLKSRITALEEIIQNEIKVKESLVKSLGDLNADSFRKEIEKIQEEIEKLQEEQTKLKEFSEKEYINNQEYVENYIILFKLEYELYYRQALRELLSATFTDLTLIDLKEKAKQNGLEALSKTELETLNTEPNLPSIKKYLDFKKTSPGAIILCENIKKQISAKEIHNKDGIVEIIQIATLFLADILILTATVVGGSFFAPLAITAMVLLCLAQVELVYGGSLSVDNGGVRNGILKTEVTKTKESPHERKMEEDYILSRIMDGSLSSDEKKVAYKRLRKLIYTDEEIDSYCDSEKIFQDIKMITSGTLQKIMGGLGLIGLGGVSILGLVSLGELGARFVPANFVPAMSWCILVYSAILTAVSIFMVIKFAIKWNAAHQRLNKFETRIGVEEADIKARLETINQQLQILNEKSESQALTPDEQKAKIELEVEAKVLSRQQKVIDIKRECLQEHVTLRRNKFLAMSAIVLLSCAAVGVSIVFVVAGGAPVFLAAVTLLAAATLGMSLYYRHNKNQEKMLKKADGELNAKIKHLQMDSLDPADLALDASGSLSATTASAPTTTPVAPAPAPAQGLASNTFVANNNPAQDLAPNPYALNNNLLCSMP